MCRIETGDFIRKEMALERSELRNPPLNMLAIGRGKDGWNLLYIYIFFSFLFWLPDLIFSIGERKKERRCRIEIDTFAQHLALKTRICP